jgi:hypothetical protein
VIRIQICDNTTLFTFTVWFIRTNAPENNMTSSRSISEIKDCAALSCRAGYLMPRAFMHYTKHVPFWQISLAIVDASWSDGLRKANTCRWRSALFFSSDCLVRHLDAAYWFRIRGRIYVRCGESLDTLEQRQLGIHKPVRRPGCAVELEALPQCKHQPHHCTLPVRD